MPTDKPSRLNERVMKKMDLLTDAAIKTHAKLPDLLAEIQRSYLTKCLKILEEEGGGEISGPELYLMTGVRSKTTAYEIIREFQETRDIEANVPMNPPAKIIHIWANEEPFCKEEYRRLPLKEGEHNFQELIYKSGIGAAAKSVIKILERGGSVKMLKGDIVKRIADTYPAK